MEKDLVLNNTPNIEIVFFSPPKAQEQWGRKPEKVRQTWHVQKSVSSLNGIFVWGEDYHRVHFFFFEKLKSG